VLGLGKSCNHEATKQGLSEVEITSFVPEAVAANPCARCDKHRRDIDKLNTEIADLKKKAVIANPEEVSSVYHNALRFWTIIYILSIRRHSSLTVRWLSLY
jgi:hypothetical protein